MNNQPTWWSVHFFPKAEQNDFLTGAFHAFITQHIWPHTGRRSFFIRYGDQSGPHLRLRFRGEAAWLDAELKPAFEQHFAEEGRWMEYAYEAEPNRFGGTDALPWAEEHFHISTRVALDRLARPQYGYGDVLFDALRMQYSAAYTAGFSGKALSDYFHQVSEQWIRAFFSPSDPANTDSEALCEAVRSDFSETLAPQREFIKDALLQFEEALTQQQFDPKQPEWLRWLRGNEIVFQGLDQHRLHAMPALLHLNNNRLGVNNQDEAYLLYMLAECAPVL